MPDHEAEMMQCLEVWGGNRMTDHAVAMAGLDAWVYSRPFGSSEQGGDVYYVSSCATGRISRLLIADVAGHGSTVGDLATELRNLMRRYVNFLDQTRFVRSMNRQFGLLAKTGCFATAVVTTFFAPNSRLSLCNAGHPPPLIYRAKAKEWSLLEEAGEVGSRGTANVPLGILDLADYEQFDVTLEPGDRVLCYTDSLMESRGEDGEMLGTAGLLGIVHSIDVGDAKDFIPALLERIAALYPTNLSEDDVTAMLLVPNVATLEVPFAQRLLAPLLVLKGMLRSIRDRGRSMPFPELSIPNIGGALISPLERLWNGTRRRARTGG